MKKYISLFLCAAIAFAACVPVNPDDGGNTTPAEYAGSRASVQMSSSDPVPADGGTLTAIVHRSPAFTASLPRIADWISCSQADSVLTLTVKANPSAVTRSAHVSIIDSELQISVTSFDVVQLGNEKDVVRKRFNVSPELIEARAEDTSAQITIEGNVEWTATSNNSDFVPTPASGEGNAKVTVNFPANTENKEIIAVITLATADEGAPTQSYEITIKQAADKSGIPAVKPEPGTVLAEWEFETNNVAALRAGGIEQVSLDDDNAPGNVGNPYVPSNVSGKGRLEYYNGIDKSTYSTTKHKRRIGTRGEPCIYATWKDDSIVWSALSASEEPLAAGTKIQLNFALRPNGAGVMRDWKCEVLDGEEWKELEAVQLEFHPDAAGTEADPKQVNAIIVRSFTLTKDTSSACFRFTCTSTFNSAGVELDELVKGDALRFAGKYLEANESQLYLQVPENPKIMVVE